MPHSRSLSELEDRNRSADPGLTAKAPRETPKENAEKVSVQTLASKSQGDSPAILAKEAGLAAGVGPTSVVQGDAQGDSKLLELILAGFGGGG